MKKGEFQIGEPHELGLVHLYTGHGKGKTTASIGLAVRAIGHGFSVFMVQFLKGGGYTGEVITANNLLQAMDIKQYGKDCVDEVKQMKLSGFNGNMVRNHENCGGCRHCFTIDEAEKMQAQRGFSVAEIVASSGEYDVVILDEICGAVNEGLIELEQVKKLIQNKHKKTELLLTGRDAPEELKGMADYVSHVKKVKHPFDVGIEARRGVEF